MAIYNVMAPLLGQFTAKNAIALACRKTGRDVDLLTPADGKDVSEGLRPMLRTLLGERLAERALEEILYKLRVVAQP
jgi:hypothetical protein